MTLLYNSRQREVNGAPETASRGTSPAVLHFKTSSGNTPQGVCRLDAEGKTSSLTGWSCQERGTALPPHRHGRDHDHGKILDNEPHADAETGKMENP